MRERRNREKIIGGWERERWEFRKGRGINENGRGEGEKEYKEIQVWEREREESWKRIRESRYNKWYTWVMKEEIPKYLEKGWAEVRWRRMIRWRLGNEMREGKYWEEEERRSCRICEGGIESWEHVWEGCGGGREQEGESWQEVVEWVLGEEGEEED